MSSPAEQTDVRKLLRRWLGLRCATLMCPCVAIHGKVRCVDCRKVSFVYGSAALSPKTEDGLSSRSEE